MFNIFYDNDRIIVQEKEDIDTKILEERNTEIYNIEHEFSEISEIMSDLSALIFEQLEEIDQIVENIEISKTDTREAVQSLSSVEIYTQKRRNIARNSVIIISGLALGTVGFIAGPIIGAVGLLSGGVLGTGVAFVTNKLF